MLQISLFGVTWHMIKLATLILIHISLNDLSSLSWKSINQYWCINRFNWKLRNRDKRLQSNQRLSQKILKNHSNITPNAYIFILEYPMLYVPTKNIFYANYSSPKWRPNIPWSKSVCLVGRPNQRYCMADIIPRVLQL